MRKRSEPETGDLAMAVADEVIRRLISLMLVLIGTWAIFGDVDDWIA